MELSQEEMTRVIKYLQRWESAKCAICKGDDWAVSSTVFALPEYTPPWKATYGYNETAFPVIPLTCKTCGNVLFVSAIAAGVVKGRIEVHQNG
jgi:hypothetical protein